MAVIALVLAFSLLVTCSVSANNPPNISIAGGLGYCAPKGAQGSIALHVSGGEGDLTFAATSLNPWFVRNQDIKIAPGGAIGLYALNVTAHPYWPGPNFTFITVTVTDEAGQTDSIVIFVAAGNSGVNTVTGTPGADMLFGLDGWDTLIGYGGKDLLCGGPGPDTLMGGPDEDTLYGNQGNDILNCGAGKDSGYGGPGADVNQGNTCENWIP